MIDIIGVLKFHINHSMFPPNYAYWYITPHYMIIYNIYWSLLIVVRSCIKYFIYFSQQVYECFVNISLNLKIRKLKVREVKKRKCTKGLQTNTWHIQGKTPTWFMYRPNLQEAHPQVERTDRNCTWLWQVLTFIRSWLCPEHSTKGCRSFIWGLPNDNCMWFYYPHFPKGVKV